MPQISRKGLLFDPRVQRSLLVRTFGYWCFCVLAVSLVLLCWEAASGPRRSFIEYFRFEKLVREYDTVLIAGLLILPVLLLDVVLISNKFAGPLYRLRRSMRALACGDEVEPIRFRETDFWHETAEEFNDILTYVDHLKQQAAAAEGRPAKSRVESEPSIHG